MSIAQLRLLNDRLRSLVGIEESIAPKVMDAVKEAIGKNTAAQQNPDGSSWPPTKSGRPALVNAAKNLTYKISVGPDATIILVILGVPEALHHVGNAKGYQSAGIRRRILPESDTDLPASVRDAFISAANSEFERRLNA